ncbi:MAG: LLM class flavin-dependent oxidoreductase [Sciscionella sp.]
MITLGIALPHYDRLFPDPAVTGAERTRRAVAYAQRAEQLGFDQIWVSDHRWLDLADQRAGSPDCWTLLAAIAATTTRIRLGSLVTNAALRDPVTLAHQVATVADIAGARLDAGLGAGWQASEFPRLPPVADRLLAVERSASKIRSLTAGTVPIWVGGKRRGILEAAARVAEGWNYAWDPSAMQYARRKDTLRAAMLAAGREPQLMKKSVGLTTLIGVDEPDLRWRWERLRSRAPGGHLAKADFDVWRHPRLVGTPDEIRRKIGEWDNRGVTHIVCGLGIPFGLFDDEQLDLLSMITST